MLPLAPVGAISYGSLGVVALMSPRVKVHHGDDGSAMPPVLIGSAFPAQITNASNVSGAKSSSGWYKRLARPCSCEYRRNVFNVWPFAAKPYGQKSFPSTLSVCSTWSISHGSMNFSAAV